jgi:uncharacterized Zn-binding protein involved in type VI secretion
MGDPIATLTSPDDIGNTVTDEVSTKFRVNGKFVAFLGSVLTGVETCELTDDLSTKLKVEGKFVGKVGSTTDIDSTITEGEPKMLVV